MRIDADFNACARNAMRRPVTMAEGVQYTVDCFHPRPDYPSLRGVGIVMGTRLWPVVAERRATLFASDHEPTKMNVRHKPAIKTSCKLQRCSHTS